MLSNISEGPIRIRRSLRNLSFCYIEGCIMELKTWKDLPNRLSRRRKLDYHSPKVNKKWKRFCSWTSTRHWYTLKWSNQRNLKIQMWSWFKMAPDFTLIFGLIVGNFCPKCQKFTMSTSSQLVQSNTQMWSFVIWIKIKRRYLAFCIVKTVCKPTTDTTSRICESCKTGTLRTL